MAEEYKVGPGRPPRHHQFEKGESGNPRGRPKRPRDPWKMIWDELIVDLDDKVEITVGQRKYWVRKSRALAKRIVSKGLAGDLRPLLGLLDRMPKAHGSNGQSGSPPSDDRANTDDDRDIVEAWKAEIRHRGQRKHENE